jgi:hypothetical protein
MIPPAELRGMLRAQPFRPIRISLTDGRQFEVRHPDLMMVGLGTAIIGLPQPGADDPFYERTTTISLLHIVSAEPLNGTAQQ